MDTIPNSIREKRLLLHLAGRSCVLSEWVDSPTYGVDQHERGQRPASWVGITNQPMAIKAKVPGPHKIRGTSVIGIMGVTDRFPSLGIAHNEVGETEGKEAHFGGKQIFSKLQPDPATASLSAPQGLDLILGSNLGDRSVSPAELYQTG